MSQAPKHLAIVSIIKSSHTLKNNSGSAYTPFGHFGALIGTSLLTLAACATAKNNAHTDSMNSLPSYEFAPPPPPPSPTQRPKDSGTIKTAGQWVAPVPVYTYTAHPSHNPYWSYHHQHHQQPPHDDNGSIKTMMGSNNYWRELRMNDNDANVTPSPSYGDGEVVATAPNLSAVHHLHHPLHWHSQLQQHLQYLPPQQPQPVSFSCWNRPSQNGSVAVYPNPNGAASSSSAATFQSSAPQQYHDQHVEVDNSANFRHEEAPSTQDTTQDCANTNTSTSHTTAKHRHSFIDFDNTDNYSYSEIDLLDINLFRYDACTTTNTATAVHNAASSSLSGVLCTDNLVLGDENLLDDAMPCALAVDFCPPHQVNIEHKKSMSSMKEIVSHDPNGSGGTVQKASMMCFSSSQQQAHQGLYHLPPLVGTRKNPSSSNASPTITPIRRVCNKQGCTNRMVQGGSCISHGAKRRSCNIPGCTKKVKKQGRCSSHGPPRKRCEFDGCVKVAVKGGRCIAHGANKKRCSLDGCVKQAVTTGMCIAHYSEVNGVKFVSGKRKRRKTVVDDIVVDDC